MTDEKYWQSQVFFKDIKNNLFKRAFDFYANTSYYI